MREADATNDTPQGPRAPKGGVRSCVGCVTKEPTDAVRRGDGRLHHETARPLVRLVLGPDREIAVDSRGGSGRGILVHPEAACIAGAVSRGLPRACKGAPKLRGEPLTAAALTDEIVRVYEQRLLSLLSTARRAGHIEVGASAVINAFHRGAVRLAIVASDAAAAADLTEVRRLVAEGRTIAWTSKRDLALAIRGKGADQAAPEDDVGVALVAVCESRIAEAMRETRRISESVRSGGRVPGGAGPEGRSNAKRKHEQTPSPRVRQDGPGRGTGRTEGRGPGPRGAGPIGRLSPGVDSSRRQTEEAGTSSAQRPARTGGSGRRDASILVGGAANLRGPGRQDSLDEGSLGVHPRRRGVKSA